MSSLLLSVALGVLAGTVAVLVIDRWDRRRELQRYRALQWEHASEVLRRRGDDPAEWHILNGCLQRRNP